MKTLFTLVLIVAFAYNTQAQIQGYNVGDVVSDFTVTDIEGHTHNLYTYTAAGKYVWMDFFFTTCGPCQSVTPVFNQFYDKYGCNEGNVICLSMNSGSDNDAAVIAYENTYGGSYHHAPAISNQGGATAVDSDFNPSQYPTICLIGPDNKLIESDIWPVSGVATFENTFPTGFNPSTMACSSFIDEEQNSVVSLTVFPNPVLDKCIVRFNITEGNTYEIKIVNILGQEILNKQVTTKETELLLGDLKRGLYIVQLYENDALISAQKIQVVR